MAAPSLTNFSIRTGTIVTPDSVLLILEEQQIAEEGISHTELAFWRRDKDWVRFSLDYDAISAAASYDQSTKNYKLIVVGDSGDCTQFMTGSDILHAEIDGGEGIASINVVNNRFLVTGIRGKIFDLTSIENIRKIYDNQLSENIESSCQYIDGKTVLCGWKGLLASVENSKIKKFDSGTNVILTDVSQKNEDELLICGQKGTVLTGHIDSLVAIDQDDVEEDFWSIRPFQGNSYVTSSTAMYQILENKTLRLFEFNGEEVPTTFYHIDTLDDSLMLLIGEKDALLFDGEEWIRIL